MSENLWELLERPNSKPKSSWMFSACVTYILGIDQEKMIELPQGRGIKHIEQKTKFIISLLFSK